ncbi:MAG: hypothetical protein WCK02_11530 [Bacteroidota bacterium]
MNKKTFLTCIALMLFFISSMGQSSNSTPEVKYRRSSLHTIIVESDYFPYKDTVLKAYFNAPFPDKYNNHTIGEKSFNPREYSLSAAEKAEIKNKSTKKNDSSYKMLPIQIDKYLKNNKIANKLVAKWFDRQEDGSFDMNLIGERGSYNASEMQANIAKGSARGISSLADAGVELIGNTFVVVSKFNFVSNEITAAVLRDGAKLAAEKLPPSLQQAAKDAADKAYEKAKEGYSVWTTSYLYKLVWNDSIEAVFYNDLWMDKTNIDPKKKEAFDNTDLFKLEFLGDERATGLVLFSLKEKRTQEQIISEATVRTVDAVYTKLQKKYDVFKPKTPLYTGYPITAKIGMKEGLKGGEKFEVFEQTIDEKTGKTIYVSKGKIKVKNNLIWDNRFNAGDAKTEATNNDSSSTAKPVIDRTTFKGGKKYYSGMLIKQIK